MRALRLLVGLWGLAACRGSGDRAVARVDHWTLSADRLARLMVLAQPLPLSAEVASELASHWVTLMAFATRIAAGDSLLDSARLADLLRHRVRQAQVAEWRRRLLAAVPGAEAAGFDSSYARALLEHRAARLDPAASGTLRDLATNPWRATDSARTLATFTGGTLAASQLQRYLQYLSPATRLEMRAAPDARLADFLWGLVLDEVLATQADSAGVRLAEGTYQAMVREVRDVVHGLWDRTGLSPSALLAEGETAAGRTNAAARKVEEYLNAAAARRVPLEAIPPFLAVPLLRQVRWEVSVDRMGDVVGRARRLLAAAESGHTP